MPQQYQHAPKLRFPEFKMDWEMVRVGDYIETISGLTYSPSNVSDQGLFVLRSSNIQNSTLSFKDNVYVNLEVNPEHHTKKGDILLCVRNGSRRLIGKSAYIDQNLENTTHGAFMSVLRGDNNDFLFQLFQTENYFREVHKNLGATINSINGSDLKKFKFVIPEDRKERQKIASFLTSVDKKINLIERKNTLLKDLKKSVTQKIFNQEIRFKDNHGNNFSDWEEKKLESVLQLALRPEDKPLHKYLAIGVRSHMKGTFQKPESDPEKIAMETLYVVKEDDLVVNITFAWEGAIAMVKPEDDGGYVSHRFPTYRCIEGQMTASYLQQIILDKKMKYMLDVISPGGAGRNRVLSKSNFLKLKLNIPCVAEQERIANFLSTIDKKIDLSSQKLTQAKAFKKALLQQMFV